MLFDYNSLPTDIQQSIAVFLGKPFAASKGFSVKNEDFPYGEIYEKYSKEIGSAKCEKRLTQFSHSHIHLTSDEHKWQDLCYDILNQCKLLGRGESFLIEKELGTTKIFNSATYLEIQRWIADENLLLICSRLLGEDFNRIQGTHAQKADIARTMLLERADGFIDINLSNLGLSQVPPEVFKFRNLINLRLYGNKLTEFNLEPGTLQLLEYLDLDQNQLTELYFQAGAFPNLKSLNLGRNQLTRFNSSPGACPNLKELNLKKNKLPQFSPVPGAFPNLERLTLEANELIQFDPLPGTFPRLFCLVMSKNRLTRFNPASQTFPRLWQLELDQNRLTEFSPEPEALPRLRLLYLEQNQLTQLIPAPGTLPRLHYLKLKKNPLMEFHASREVFPNLHHIELDQKAPAWIPSCLRVFW
jgi:Leucine-rich repeat (LRR) protein